MKSRNNSNNSYYNLYKKLKKQLQTEFIINRRRNTARNTINTNEETNKSPEINKRRDGVKWTDVAMVLITAFLAYYTFALFEDTSKSTKAATESVEVAKLALQAAKEKDSIENIFRNITDSIEDIERERSRERDSISMGLTRQSSEISEKALTETKRSYEFSREAAIKEIRAYVVLDNINLNNFNPDSLISAKITITNIGKSPAYNVSLTASLAFGKTGDGKYIDGIVNHANNVRRDTLSTITLGTSQKTSVFVLPHMLSKREYAALKNESYSLYVTINAAYFDIFNIPRFTKNVGRLYFEKLEFLTVSKYNVAN